MSTCSVLFLISKEEVNMDEPISNSTKKGQGKLLIIDGDHEVGEPCMFGKGMYLYVLC